MKTPGSLLVVTTTARILRENLGYDAYVYAKQVASGAIVDEACALLRLGGPQYEALQELSRSCGGKG